MAGSYRKINYSVRPAKAIERKMLCDAFRRLSPFARVATYRYIGFGSIYFTDFHLFHRSLGMDDMLSIEKDADAEECFLFNKPYNCVRLDCRPASAVLPELDWQTKSIVWLDYDGKLDESVLSDITTVGARSSSGSVLVISVNANVEGHPDETVRQEYKAETGLGFDLDDYRLREFRNRVGDALPPESLGSELRGRGLARISRMLIHNRLQETLSVRNGLLPPEKKILYRQLFNFHYSDGARMLTVGGIFFEAGDLEKFDASYFSELSFCRFGQEPYTIQVPCLTMKEMRQLNAQLPKTPAAELSLPGVPSSDIQRYAELYRYFPTFAEAIFT
jgi:Putative O-methyltransferase